MRKKSPVNPDNDPRITRIYREARLLNRAVNGLWGKWVARGNVRALSSSQHERSKALEMAWLEGLYAGLKLERELNRARKLGLFEPPSPEVEEREK